MPDAPRRLDEAVAREQVVEVCRRMHDRGLIAGGEGNVSVRLAPSRLLVTPSGANKGFLKAADLVATDLDGRPEHPRRKVSSEVRLHLAAYRARPDIGAVVHAHPPAAIAFTLAGLPLDQRLVPEAITALGDIPTAAYATPSTEDLAAGVRRLLPDHDVVMMERHGSVCVGIDVFQAYDRLESLEHTARICHLARTLGRPEPLPEEEVARLRRIADAQGVRRPRGPADGARDALSEEILARVLEALARHR